MKPTIEWRTHPASRFSQFAADWDTLNAHSARLPFLESRALQCALRWFAPPGLLLAVGTQQSRVMALGFLGPHGRLKWETWQPSQLPLGAFVIHPTLALGPTLAGLITALPGYPLALGLTQLDPDIHPRSSGTAQLTTLDYVPTARVRIEGSFDDYWAARGKNLRHNIKRQQARIAAHGITTRLECLTRPEDVATAIAQYSALEGASWKAGLGTALAPDNDQGRFYGDLLEAFAATGQTRIYRYCLDDQVAAMDLCLLHNDTLVILKTACRDDLKGLSPAVLMHREIFAALFAENRLTRVEFYGRLMEWHTRWTQDTRMLYHLTFYRTAWVPRLRTLQRALTQRALEPA